MNDKAVSKTVSLRNSRWVCVDGQPEGRSEFIDLAVKQLLDERGVKVEGAQQCPWEAMEDLLREALAARIDVETLIRGELARRADGVFL